MNIFGKLQYVFQTHPVAKLLLILLLIVGIPITVFIAQKRQEIRQHANAPSGQMHAYLARQGQTTPLPESLILGNTTSQTPIDLELYLDTNNGTALPVSGFDLVLSYGTGLTLTGVTQADGAGRFNVLLWGFGGDNNGNNDTAKTFRFAKVSTATNTSISGQLHLATLTFTPIQHPTSSNLRFTNTVVTVPGFSNSADVSTTPVTYTFEGPLSITPPPTGYSASYSISPADETRIGQWVEGQAQTYTIGITNTGSQPWDVDRSHSNRVQLAVYVPRQLNAQDLQGEWNTAFYQQLVELPDNANHTILSNSVPVNVPVTITLPAGTFNGQPALQSYVLVNRLLKQGGPWFSDSKQNRFTSLTPTPTPPVRFCSSNADCQTGYYCPPCLPPNPPTGLTCDPAVCQPIPITRTPTPTPTTAPTNTPVPGAVSLGFDVKLIGIGATAGENNNPKNPSKLLTVQIFNGDEVQVGADISAMVAFNQQTGKFAGTANLPASIQPGPYIVKVKVPGNLRKRIPGITTITQTPDGRPLGIPSVTFIAGDIDGNNQIDILDYNILLDCGYAVINPLPMSNAQSKFNSAACQAHAKSTLSDLNDDGIIDTVDYAIFSRGLAVISGD